MSESEHLALLLRVNTILSSTKSVDDVLKDMIEEVIDTLGAERGFVVLRDGEGWQSTACHYVDRHQELEATQFSHTLVEKVATEGAALLSVNALGEQRFSNIPSIQMQTIRSVLCAPLRWDGQIHGVVYADHRVRSGAFKNKDLELFSAIADQASRTLQTAALHQKLQQIHQQSLERARTAPNAPDSLSEWEEVAVPETVDLLLGTLTDPEIELAPPVPAPESDGLRAYLFGPLRIEGGALPFKGWKSRKDGRLFAYLATHTGQLIHEDKLVDLFWSRGGKKGRHSLHNSVTQIRKVLGDSRREFLQRVGDGYTVGPSCWLDLKAFSGAFQAGAGAAREDRWGEALVQLREAEALASRELLEGSAEDWLEPHRLRVAEQLSECRRLLADYFTQRGKPLMAIELWRRMLEHDNCNETAFRGLLDAYRTLGRKAEAVRACEAFAKAYREELDLEPPPDLATFE